MDAVERYAARIGCSRIEVTSGDHREQDAHIFYQILGYKADCRRFIKSITVNTEQGAAANPYPLRSWQLCGTLPGS